MNTARIAALGLLTYGAWTYWQSQQDAAAVDASSADQLDAVDTATRADWLGTTNDVLSTAGETAAEFIDSLTGGILQVSAMARVNPLDITNRNVRAMLAVIRRGEGTTDDDGYRRIFGGQLFTSFADHPRITVKKSGYTSSAAGAYQATISTWDETKRIMQLPDFSPRSQDLFALGRIVARGALDDVKQGRFDAALKKLGREWASLPYSPYGQPTISLQTARQVFASAGGSTDTALA